MNERQARELVARLIDAFPQTHVREQTVTVYERYVRDLDYERTACAIEELIAGATQLPAIAHVRRRVIIEQLSYPTPMEAFASLSTRDTPTHDFTKRVANLFGGPWNILNAEKPSIARAQFLKAYEDVLEEEVERRNSASYRGRKVA